MLFDWSRQPFMESVNEFSRPLGPALPTAADEGQPKGAVSVKLDPMEEEEEAEEEEEESTPKGPLA